MNDEIQKLIDLESSYNTNLISQSASYKINDDAIKLGLTETEFLVIRLLTSNGASLIQKPLYALSELSELELLLCEHLDNALSKLPLEKSTDVVFRWDSKPIVRLEDVGHKITYPAYLTASEQNLSTNLKNLYIIHLSENTKARCVYSAYEITPGDPELQVEFPRNTEFYVDKYETMNDGIVKIEMTEL